MSNPRITQALNNLFAKHRIVFWYDANREFRTDFESLALTFAADQILLWSGTTPSVAYPQ